MCTQAYRGVLPSAVPAIAGRYAELPRSLAERHYTMKEVATLWNLSQSKIRELFANESGVMREGKPTRRVGGGSRRGYYTTRIPESAVLRVHRRLTGIGWYAKLAFERHYTPQQLAAALGLSDTKVRRMFFPLKSMRRVLGESPANSDRTRRTERGTGMSGLPTIRQEGRPRYASLGGREGIATATEELLSQVVCPRDLPRDQFFSRCDCLFQRELGRA